MKTYPSQEEIKLALDYYSESGEFVWKPGRFRAGRKAGSMNALGYLTIWIGNRQFMAHVLAWIYVYGYRPEVVDHVDGDRSNNRITNLRSANRAQNRVNSKNNRKARFLKGVSIDPRCPNRFYARYYKDGKSVHIGAFGSEQEAYLAYVKAASQHFGQFVRSVHV